MFGDIEKKQEELQAKLQEIEITHQMQGISIVATGDQRIKNIKIDAAVLADGDAEQLEDLLTVAINQALEQAAETGAMHSQDMIKDMLGGMGGMFGNMLG